MSMYIWRVEFDYQIEGREDWMSDLAHHLGSDSGGIAVNYVRDKMLGSEVEISVGPAALPQLPQFSNKLTKQIVDWRLRGLTQICKVNFIDMDVLNAAGVISYQQEDHEEQHATEDQSSNVAPAGAQESDADSYHGPCEDCTRPGCPPGEELCRRTEERKPAGGSVSVETIGGKS